MNAKGRVKEDGTFKFYEQESSRRGMSYHARRTAHGPRRTTHYPPNHANKSIRLTQKTILTYLSSTEVRVWFVLRTVRDLA